MKILRLTIGGKLNNSLLTINLLKNNYVTRALLKYQTILFTALQKNNTLLYENLLYCKAYCEISNFR